MALAKGVGFVSCVVPTFVFVPSLRSFVCLLFFAVSFLRLFVFLQSVSLMQSGYERRPECPQKDCVWLSPLCERH